MSHLVSRLAPEDEEWNPTAIFFGSPFHCVLDADNSDIYDSEIFNSLLRISPYGNKTIDQILPIGSVFKIHDPDDESWMQSDSEKVLIAHHKVLIYGIETIVLTWTPKDSEFIKNMETISLGDAEDCFYGDSEIIIHGNRLLKLFDNNHEEIIPTGELIPITRNILEEYDTEEIHLHVKWEVKPFVWNNGKKGLSFDYEYSAHPRASDINGGGGGEYTPNREIEFMDSLMRQVKSRYPRRKIIPHIKSSDCRKKTIALDQFF